MKLFFIRAFRAAKLDATVFDEVMENAKLMTQAIIVVFIYGAAVAYGTFGRAGVAGINGAIFITLIGWYIWAFSTYIAGVRLFPETGTTADRKAFMRAMGFASSPGWLRFLTGSGDRRGRFCSDIDLDGCGGGGGGKKGSQLYQHPARSSHHHRLLDPQYALSGVGVYYFLFGFRHLAIAYLT